MTPSVSGMITVLFTTSLHPSSLANNTGLRVELNLSLLELVPGLIFAAILRARVYRTTVTVNRTTDTPPNPEVAKNDRREDRVRKTRRLSHTKKRRLQPHGAYEFLTFIHAHRPSKKCSITLCCFPDRARYSSHIPIRSYGFGSEVRSNVVAGATLRSELARTDDTYIDIPAPPRPKKIFNNIFGPRSNPQYFLHSPNTAH